MKAAVTHRLSTILYISAVNQFVPSEVPSNMIVPVVAVSIPITAVKAPSTFITDVELTAVARLVGSYLNAYPGPIPAADIPDVPALLAAVPPRAEDVLSLSQLVPL